MDFEAIPIISKDVLLRADYVSVEAVSDDRIVPIPHFLPADLRVVEMGLLQEFLPQHFLCEQVPSVLEDCILDSLNGAEEGSRLPEKLSLLLIF